MFGKLIYQTGSFFLVLIVFIVVSVSGNTPAGMEPVYIGVLLPLTGPDGEPLLHALQIGVEEINEGGGIGGRPVNLILRDTATGDIRTYARDLADDSRIWVVIGPYSSDDLFMVSDLFIKNQKILISPTASADDIYRAFAGTGTVWRTVANDGDITSMVMEHLSSHHVKDVAILTINSSYGKTFYDWIPFWAIETGIAITGAEEYSSPDQIPGAIGRLTGKNPGYLVFVHSGSGNEISSAINTFKQLNSTIPLYLVYPNADEQGFISEKPDPEVLQALLASGFSKLTSTGTISTRLPDNTLLLMSKPWDPDFVADFKKVSKKTRADYVPETYDALLIASAVMARFSAYPEKSPRNAAMEILSNGTGDPLPRTKEGFQEGFNLIRAGQKPVFSGLTGPLTFRSEGTDRLTPWCDTYRIEGGEILSEPFEYSKLDKSSSGFTKVTNKAGVVIPENRSFSPDNYRAIIGAFSRDWVNYRHQADVLTVYQYLKKQGVPDNHILLLVYDDIPNDKRNKKPGEVFHTPSEEEVRKQANPDYIGEMVNKIMLKDILSGSGMFRDHPFLDTDENSTILLYLSSHGIPGGDMVFGNGSEHLSPEELLSDIEILKKEKKFGQMMIILESCFSGTMVTRAKTPGVVILSAAAPDETSKAAIYDSDLSNWISDEFTFQLISLLRNADRSITVGHFFQQVYHNVRSSHPGITNNTPLLDVPVLEFFGGS